MRGRRNLLASCVGLLAATAALTAGAHPGHHHHPHDSGHHHHHDHASQSEAILLSQAPAEAAPQRERTSGQGELTFRVLYTADHLPEEALAVLVRAHGGFAVDRREGAGEVYFALPGAGIVRLSRDLRQSALVPTPEEMRDTNMHNTAIWYAPDGAPRLSFPGNEVGKIFTTTLEGELLHTLQTPENVQFEVAEVNTYFTEGGGFVPTDIAKLNGMFYITTGYSPLDYVLTARVQRHEPLEAAWHGLAFGGKGTEPGQFGTGHGITVTPDNQEIVVADRPHSELDLFSPQGEYRGTVSLPEGSYPCDADFESGYTVVGCLHGPDREQGAPIYILKDGELVSTVMPKEELGLENFQHIHNAVMVNVDDTLYLIAQAWNPGDFAILEQVKQAP